MITPLTTTALALSIFFSVPSPLQPQPPLSTAPASPAPAASPDPDYATARAQWLIAHQPDEPNRWSTLANELARIQGAWALYSITDPDIARWQSSNSANLEPTAVLTPAAADLKPRVVAFLDALERMKTPDILSSITAEGSFVPPRPAEPLLDETLFDTGQVRLFARLWSVRMRLAIESANPDRFTASFAHLHTVARAASSRGQFIGRFLAIAADSLALAEARRALRAGTLDPDHCRTLLSAIDDRPELLSLPAAIRAEQFVALDSVTQTHQKAAKEARRSADPLDPRAAHAADDLTPLPDQLALVDRIFSAAAVGSGPNRTLRAQAWQDLQSARKLIADQHPRFDAVGLLLPAFDKAVEADQRYAADLAATRAMLALELFKVREGHYPDALAELVPDFLTTLPLDPHADSDTTPIGYRREKAPPPITPANGYTLSTTRGDRASD